MIRKRSVTLSGHRTSVSVEDEFWNELKAIAAADKRAVTDVLMELDAARGGNLSSAVRLYVLKRLKAKAP